MITDLLFFFAGMFVPFLLYLAALAVQWVERKLTEDV